MLFWFKSCQYKQVLKRYFVIFTRTVPQQKCTQAKIIIRRYLSSFADERLTTEKSNMTEKIFKDTEVPEYAHFSRLFQEIIDSARENATYFSQKKKDDFTKSFQTILNVVDPLQISLEVVTNCCHRFDTNPNCPGNGYRSVISIIESCLQKILITSQQIQRSREKLWFRSYHMYMELESYVQVLSRLLTVCNLAIVLLDYSEVGNLFPKSCVMDDMIADFEKISRECFYGRSFGFQYTDSIRQAMQVVAVAMAAYGDGYRHHNHSFTRALSSMLHSGKYMVNPELRAHRITELTQNANIDFCKAFWSLTEEYGVQHAPLLLCPAMAVNLEFEIPTKSLRIKTLHDDFLTVDFPFMNSKQTGIKCRLLSYMLRDGQKSIGTMKEGFTQLGPRPTQRSRYLMIHCHGGGFVAQSSKSHEMYLRYWAKELQIPILSIDYSLAPDAPYPQAVNEVYFTYVWALNNLEKLGSTGEKICFTGDSAGANLVTVLALKAIKDNIRLPDSIVVAYPPYRLQFIPSPSRMLCLMDPLLPFGVLKSCIQAYTGSYIVQENAKSANSFSYDGGNYNAYDLDFGGNTGHQHKHHSHSYSESQLNIIKNKFAQNECVDENTSFCSEFPFSETDSSLYCSSQSDDDTHSMKGIKNSFIFFEAPKKSELDRSEQHEMHNQNTRSSTDTTSIFHSLTLQMTSKVQVFTAGVTDYFYGGENNKQPDGGNLPIESHQETRSTQTSTKSTEKQTNNDDDDKIPANHNESNEIIDYNNMNERKHASRKCNHELTPTCAIAAPEMIINNTRINENLVESCTIMLKRDELADIDIRTNSSEPEAMFQTNVTENYDLIASGICTNNKTDITRFTENNENSYNVDAKKELRGKDYELLNSKPTKTKNFSLCKDCLEKSEHCTCGELSSRLLRRRGDKHRRSHKHYKFSHHHMNSHHNISRSYSDNPDEIKQSNRQRSITLCDGDQNGEDDQLPCSPTIKNKMLLNLRLSLLSNPELNRQNNFQETNDVNSELHRSNDLNSPCSSPRVVYDRTNEQCTIVTSEDGDFEMVDENTPVCGDRHLYGASSKAFEDAKDPFMSPYLADDELLKRLPPISIVASALDPLLDDSVEFVKKLQGLNNNAELYILENLPHGFLNFQPFSSDAREGCDLLVACVKKSLAMGMRRTDSTVSFTSKKKSSAVNSPTK